MPKSVLVLGATGYIGSTALDRLLPLNATKFTVYARNASVLEGFEAVDSRIVGVQGGLDDTDKLEELAAAHDVTVNCANADHLGATEAILRGMKKRLKETQMVPILIHTSGTGTLSDTDAGTTPGTVVYTDGSADPTQSPPYVPISSLPESAFHRNVDLAIVRADAAGYVRSYIILPSTIYGISKNVFADKKLANPQSQQVPQLIRMSIDRGAAAMVGDGANFWPDVHIHDCADLYALVYKVATKGSGGDHGSRGYYFAESGEHTLKQVADQIGKVLYDKGIVKSPEPKTLSQAELDKYMGGSSYLGTNSRARAVHSRAVGWEPKHTVKDFMSSIKEDTEWTIANSRAKDDTGKFVWGMGPVLVNGGWRLPE